MSVPSIIRDVVPGTQPGLQRDYDTSDPTCVWTFASPGGLVGPGLFSSLTSPWIAKERSDSTNVLFGYSAKLNARDQNIFIQFRVRGKKVGDTHATFLGRMNVLFFGAGGASEVAALVVSDADVEKLAGAARERLSSFKVPTLWYVTTSADVVPMSATGKVDKSALQELLRSHGVHAGTAARN